MLYELLIAKIHFNLLLYCFGGLNISLSQMSKLIFPQFCEGVAIIPWISTRYNNKYAKSVNPHIYYKISVNFNPMNFLKSISKCVLIDLVSEYAFWIINNDISQFYWNEFQEKHLISNPTFYCSRIEVTIYPVKPNLLSIYLIFGESFQQASLHFHLSCFKVYWVFGWYNPPIF